MQRDAGWEEVRALAETDRLACCLRGRAEVVAAFHRKFRERAIGEKDLTILIKEFDRDSEAGAFRSSQKVKCQCLTPLPEVGCVGLQWGQVRTFDIR